MKILLDTNIMMDAIEKREPSYLVQKEKIWILL